jgi:hypothetical protein
MLKTVVAGVAGNRSFCLLVAQPPNPFSQNSILRLRTVPALFSPALQRDF